MKTVLLALVALIALPVVASACPVVVQGHCAQAAVVQTVVPQVAVQTLAVPAVQFQALAVQPVQAFAVQTFAAPQVFVQQAVVANHCARAQVLRVRQPRQVVRFKSVIR